MADNNCYWSLRVVKHDRFNGPVGTIGDEARPAFKYDRGVGLVSQRVHPTGPGVIVTEHECVLAPAYGFDRHRPR